MEPLTISAEIKKPVEQVWDTFNDPQHITKWNLAHESWECPSAANDLRVGGRLEARMQARDGSFGFDFIGIYDEIKDNEHIRYHLEDGRKVEVIFEKLAEDRTRVTEHFDPESQNTLEMQQQGWQAILDNFKRYSETI